MFGESEIEYTNKKNGVIADEADQSTWIRVEIGLIMLT